MLHGYPKEILPVKERSNTKYYCSNCFGILRDPVQNICGHRFCRLCYEELTKKEAARQDQMDGGPQPPECPACLASEEQEDEVSTLCQVFPDKALQREMSKLHVQCYHPSCQWTGPFNQLDVHLTNCQKQRLKCEECGRLFPKEEMEKHQESHEKEGIRCKYGCEGRIQQSKIKKHNQDEIVSHLSNIYGKLAQLDKEFKEYNTIIQQGVFTEQAKNYSSAANSAAKLAELNTAVIPSQGQSNQASALAIAAESTAETSMDNGKNKLAIFEGVLVVINREVAALSNTVDGILATSKKQQDSMNMLIDHVNKMSRQNIIKDALITELKLKVEMLESVSYDGTLIWKIEGFRQKRAEALSGSKLSFYSPPFFTSRTGYKICARIYLNGDGSGKSTHVSLFFVVMRGQYDAILPWPFSHKVTMMFLDQNNRSHVIESFRPDPNSNSFHRPVNEMNIASGCPHFLSLSLLDDPLYGYVKDDTAFIKIIVSTS